MKNILLILFILITGACFGQTTSKKPDAIVFSDQGLLRPVGIITDTTKTFFGKAYSVDQTKPTFSFRLSTEEESDSFSRCWILVINKDSSTVYLIKKLR